jgi:hypothetical protein
VVHNFTTSGTNSQFFTFAGSISDKGTVVYEGIKLTKCFKMESSTSITFTTSEEATITLILGGTNSKNNWRICIDGEEYTPIIPDGETSYRICTVTLKAGTHEITKKDVTNIYYIIIK